MKQVGISGIEAPKNSQLAPYCILKRRLARVTTAVNRPVYASTH
jgi:hypothetical protein